MLCYQHVAQLSSILLSCWRCYCYVGSYVLATVVGYSRPTVLWCGVVWCGVVWCGVVWCGVVWCGVVLRCCGVAVLRCCGVAVLRCCCVVVLRCCGVAYAIRLNF